MSIVFFLLYLQLNVWWLALRLCLLSFAMSQQLRSSSRDNSPVPWRARGSSGLAAIVAGLPGGRASIGSAPPPLSDLRISSVGSANTSTAPISSRSAGLSVTGGALVRREQALFHLAEADVGKLCCGLIQSSSGANTCVCIEDSISCNVLAHKKSVRLIGDAYYARSRNSSVVIWPFVLEAHLTGSSDPLDTGLVSAERSTLNHLEAFHAFYDRHSDHLRQVLALPRVKSIIGFPSSDLHRDTPAEDPDARSVLSSRSVAPLDSDSVVASVSGSHQGLLANPHSPGMIEIDSISISSVGSWEKLEAHFNEFESSIQAAIADISTHAEDLSMENVLASVTALGSTMDDFQLIAIEAIRAEKRDLDRLRQSVARIKKVLTIITDEVNGCCLPADTYQVYGSVWEAIFSSLKI